MKRPYDAHHAFLWLPILVALVLLTSPVRAQIGVPVEPAPPERDGDCTCLEDLGERLERAFVAFSPRARLGVMLGERIEVDGRAGVSLDDVPEGTPARAAGLRTGDVVVALDGEELGRDPRRGILDAMADREPGDTVAVTYYRDGAERTVEVVAEETPSHRFFGRGPLNVRVAPSIELEDLQGRLEALGGLRHGGLRFGHDLELVTVGPELGEYFGTDRGVLVASIEDDSPLDLRPGDVILAIGDREPRDPAHARAILASYRDGEEITIRIMRDRRERTVTGTHDGG